MVGRLADSYGKVPVFIIATLATIPMLLIVTRLGHTPLPLVLTLTAAMFAVMGGRFVPAMALATTVVPPQQRGSFMSLNTSIQQLASGAAAYLAGLIVMQTPTGKLLHYELVGYIAVAANLVSLLAIRRIKPASVAAGPSGTGAAPDKIVVNTPLSEQAVD
jgi:predicted MFS family arabinose efflux permease